MYKNTSPYTEPETPGYEEGCLQQSFWRANPYSGAVYQWRMWSSAGLPCGV